MPLLRTTVIAAAMISAGLTSTAGMALASDHGGDTLQKGAANSSDFAPNTPVNVCQNDVPVNLVGGQVPIQDNVLSVPALSEAGHGNSAGNAKGCSNPIDARN